MNIKSPLISIIVPTFNIAAYIRETCNCLTYISNRITCEVIFQDNESTDGTTDIIKSFVDRNKQWQVFSEPDTGQSNAINRGAKRAHGKWITWLCGDDLLRPEFIKMMLDPQLEKYTVAYGDVVFTDGDNYFPAIGTETYHPGILSRKRLMIQQPGTIIKLSTWKELSGVREDLNFHMDYDLFLRLENLGVKFKRYRLFISQAVIRPEAKTSSPSYKRLQEYFDIFPKAHLRNPHYFSLRPYLVYSTEYLLKNLEASIRQSNNHLIIMFHSLFTKIFWFLAKPVEKQDIEIRYRLIEKTTYYD